MTKRQIKKIVKKYGDNWWEVLFENSSVESYFLSPPSKWATAKILKEFQRQHYGKQSNMFWYSFKIS